MAQPVLKFANGVTVKDGVITAILSTEAVDRDGDVVTLEGWDLTNFAKAPRLMSCHDYSSLTKQIGEWRNVRIDKARGALIGEPHYYTGQGNPEADWAYFLATQGQATFSVGFAPTEFEPRKGAGMVYTRKELLECSHVPIPANQEALQLMAKAFAARQPGQSVHKAEMGGDEQTCVQMAQDLLDGLNRLILHEAQEQVGGEDEDDDIRLLLACRDMIQQFQQRELLGDTGDYGYGLGYAYMAAGTRMLKAGRTISAANLNQLHTAMDAIHAVHDGACKDANCAYNNDDDGDELPPTERDKAAKAAGESSGAAGGVAISDSGTHGAFTGRHSHSHDAAGHTSSADDDGNHEHMHSHDDDGNHGHSHDGANFKTLREREITRAEQSTAQQNDLPDSAFAVISAGGEKDAEGKTTPRSLRHLPHHKADGSIDLPHLKTWKNALARVSQTDLSAEDRAKAEAHLEKHAKEEKIGDYAEKDATQGLDPQAVQKAVEAQISELLEGIV